MTFHLAVALTLSVFATTASAIDGVVVRVADGDTITVLDESGKQHKIRLAGIDAPEARQAFGQSSKGHLSGLVYGKTVHIESSKLDRYGREVGKVSFGGVDINLLQVKGGFAWHYKLYAHEQNLFDRTAYSLAEEKAKQERRGLWLDREAEAPWEYRARLK